MLAPTGFEYLAIACFSMRLLRRYTPRNDADYDETALRLLRAERSGAWFHLGGLRNIQPYR